MSDDHGLVDTEMADTDEWEEIHVEDSEADRIAKSHDRDFEEFAIRLKDTEQFKVEGAVFDDATLAALYKLVQDGYIDAFGGPISTGKEANVYLADGPDGEIAVKVYLINTSNFRQMRDYLEGDPRFEGIGNQKRQVVMAWVKKEFANLRRAKEAGVRVPNPIAVERNVLVMEYLGQGDDRARRLGEVHIENPETAFEVVREYMCRLYDSGLVHGDLSEYNIVVHEGELTIIDLGQAVTVHHPNSRDFLERDCRNIANFFARQSVDTDGTSLLAHVTEQER
ncbi:serine/threonine-protein kinase Rio1 [Haladaptatus sp. GCM10025707]|uniref:serine/threonine-protein kinase Rio1 n=1 Tax=unclassified Haladaptatus TaxID=2622732 RepID=UPI0023E7798F|nr:MULTISPECIES: serine/threonine-protein kinase Rio1 [unclassified Haladaptatus]